MRRIPVDIFEKWYADQDIYRKVTHIPTAEELEKDYICLQDAAELLGISREKDTVSLEIKEYISRQDAAKLAGVSVSTVTKWMQSGEFQCIGAGKVLRVHRQQFLKWLEKNREDIEYICTVK